jgi:putative peptide zinc metalloprotease protein
VVNQNDGKVRSDGRLQGKTMHNGNVQPVNQAYALASCTNCQTYAVAMQIVVYPKSATTVAPVNEAIALNYHCTGCNTVARALQYAIPTDDPDKLPPSVQNLSRQIAREVGSIQQTPAITPAEADARVNAVIVQFGDLAQNLSDKRSETHDQDSPNASPLPSTSAAPSGAASPSPTTVDLSATATPTSTVTPDQAASQGQNAAATPAPSNSTG